MSTESMRKRLDRLERVGELGVDVSKWLSDWQNPEPGVLTWRYYVIRRRRPQDSPTLFRGPEGWAMDTGELATLKDAAERDFAERVEMGEVEA